MAIKATVKSVMDDNSDTAYVGAQLMQRAMHYLVSKNKALDGFTVGACFPDIVEVNMSKSETNPVSMGLSYDNEIIETVNVVPFAKRPVMLAADWLHCFASAGIVCGRMRQAMKKTRKALSPDEWNSIAANAIAEMTGRYTNWSEYDDPDTSRVFRFVKAYLTWVKGKLPLIQGGLLHVVRVDSQWRRRAEQNIIETELPLIDALTEAFIKSQVRALLLDAKAFDDKSRMSSVFNKSDFDYTKGLYK